jgi:hypothetical protein
MRLEIIVQSIRRGLLVKHPEKISDRNLRSDGKTVWARAIVITVVVENTRALRKHAKGLFKKLLGTLARLFVSCDAYRDFVPPRFPTP